MEKKKLVSEKSGKHLKQPKEVEFEVDGLNLFTNGAIRTSVWF